MEEVTVNTKNGQDYDKIAEAFCIYVRGGLCQVSNIVLELVTLWGSIDRSPNFAYIL